MTISLQEIFIAQPTEHIDKKQDLFSLKLNPIFLNSMATELNLSYVESALLEENICFANNSEVRPEFRTFSIKGMLLVTSVPFLTKPTFELKKVDVPFPINVAMFWSFVKSSAM